MKKGIISILALVLCAALVFTGCSKGAKMIETKDAKALNETIVAEVGETKISQADFNLIYMMLYQNMAQYSSFYGEDWENMEMEEGKTILDMIREGTVTQVKQLAAIYKLCEEKDIDINKDVKEAVQKTKEDIVSGSFGGEEGFKDFLEESRTTDKAFTNYLQVAELYTRLYNELTKVGGEVEIKEKELEKQFLEENKDKWRVQHILISTQPQTDEAGNETPAKTDAEAKKITDEVLAKLDAGEDFDKLIDKYGEDPGISSGNYYLFGAGEMAPEFEEASKNLEIGAYTKTPVKSDFGYHIIKRYEINKDIKEFKDFKDTKKQEKASEYVQKEMDKLDAKFEDKVIDPYLEKWAKERKEAAKKAQEEMEKQQAEANSETGAEADARTAEKE